MSSVVACICVAPLYTANFSRNYKHHQITYGCVEFEQTFVRFESEVIVTGHGPSTCAKHEP
ncbi:hypothetical protein VO64_0853 [Pseudomonas synxantha]|uniref:Secreted protein n=1 Tax=Pseudomonas synxantha TaxID=47883 RepID=A0AAU8TLL0_9PSED|nr:hypothetical protein VO64_0853 [Pseudomonas synxantha]